jgi:hypothetical protein
MTKGIIEDVTKALLAEDNHWLKANFNNVQTLRKKKTQSISWVIREHFGENTFIMRYEHVHNNNKTMHALLKITLNEKTCLEKQIELNQSRFEIIKQCYMDIKRDILKDSKEFSTKDLR